MSMRNKQKQIWSDLDFIDKLEKIKAKRLLNNNPVKNMGQLTKEIIKCPSFETLERELIDFGKKNSLIKFDKKRRLY